MAARTNDTTQSQDEQRQDDPVEDETAPRPSDLAKSQDSALLQSAAAPPVSLTEPPETSIDNNNDESSKTWPHSMRYLVLLCAFIATFGFSVTQVPLLYVFRLMTCDAYYDEHPEHVQHDAPFSPTMRILEDLRDDRCSIHPIESATALAVSVLGASTTVFGLVNLFITGGLIKRIGIKATLFINILFPAVRLVIQNIGVEVWGSVGIIIVQLSQITTILGGPNGYVLSLNMYMTEVVEFKGRTAALGRIQGSMMFGSATGFLLGGILAEKFGIKTPFRLTVVLFLFASAYVMIFLPRIPPEARENDAANTTHGFLQKFFGPLAVFAPKKFMRRDGGVQIERGALLLACGVFLGILATGYLQSLLQLFATDAFGFGTAKNGWLIFMYFLLRGLFLTFAFPKLIDIGRRWESQKEDNNKIVQGSEREPLLQASEQGPSKVDNGNPHKKEQRFTFDLTYTRFSLLADGMLTLLCTFVQHGWQMYLVAAALPFAAGTGAASKGTILQMIGSDASSAERTDALAGISLVENMARLSTTFVFGVIFAAFASVGRTELTFTCNAAIALIGFVVLLFARFPPEDDRSSRIK